jgi:hypothetical protein
MSEPALDLVREARKATLDLNTFEGNKIYAYRAALGMGGARKGEPLEKYQVGGYGPSWYQEQFHKAVKRSRWLFWPNQVGKTYGAVADTMMIALGIHPYIKVPVPNRGVVLTISHLKSVQVVRPSWEDYLPADVVEGLYSVSGEGRWTNRNAEKPSRIVLPNKSIIEFMSCDQNVKEFESLTLHWAHADEELPEEIYNALKIRLLKNFGFFLCSMTPWMEEGLGGISWTADRILQNKNLPEKERDPEVWISPYITMDDSPWLDEAAIENWKKVPMSKEEYNARFHGIHMQRSGRIFETFKDKGHNPKDVTISGHLLPAKFPINPAWNRILVIDPASPSGTTAALWVAVTTAGMWQGIRFKQDELVFYREYKEQDLTVAEHAGNILAQTGGEPLERKLMDGRFMEQSADANSGTTYGQMYREHGLYCEGWGANLIEHEIQATKEYLKGTMDRADKQPGIFILDHMRELRWEIDHYIYPMHGSGELKGERKPIQRKKHKKIHLVDCLKAACNLRLKHIKRYWERDLDDQYAAHVDPLTGY